MGTVPQTGQNRPKTGFPVFTRGRAGPRLRLYCLECAAIFRHLPLTVRCRLGDYTKTMMTKRILTICAAVSAALAVEAGEPRSRWRRAIRPSPGPGLFDGTASSSTRRLSGRLSRAPRARRISTCWKTTKVPMDARDSTALPPPGPVISPERSTLWRPPGLSRSGLFRSQTPDDPRYGRLAG